MIQLYIYIVFLKKFLFIKVFCFLFCFVFLMWTIFKVFTEFFYNIASVLCFGFLALRHVGSYLAPWPGIKPTPLALEDEVLTTGPPGKSLLFVLDHEEFSYLITSLKKKKNTLCIFVHTFCVYTGTSLILYLVSFQKRRVIPSLRYSVFSKTAFFSKFF